jgi:hypothetical protein
VLGRAQRVAWRDFTCHYPNRLLAAGRNVEPAVNHV